MSKLLELVKTKLGCGYVWGAQGEVLTENLLEKFIAQHGAKRYRFASGSRVIDARKWLGEESFDCSGILVWGLIKLGVITANEDYDAGTLYYKFCYPISLSALRPGDLVFRRNSVGEIVHVGIYNGDNTTVEAKGTEYGVVIGDVNDFNVFGRLKSDFGGASMQKGDKGPKVIDLQNKLRSIGYDLVADGDFGTKTELAVSNFQLHNNLRVDGVVGQATLEKINDMVNKLKAPRGLTWEEILDKESNNPNEWKEAIKAHLNDDSGMWRFMPQLIEKLYNKGR